MSSCWLFDHSSFQNKSSSHKLRSVTVEEVVTVFILSAERLLKMSLEELREFLQERIAQTFFYSDDVIIEQLQASISELRKMKLDLPPPGTRLHSWLKSGR